MKGRQKNLGLRSSGGGNRGPVECLGMEFENDQARRAYFLEKLAEKLKEPEFRETPGFPDGTDEDILRLSEPPYYTACPNPFLRDFVRCYGKPYDPEAEYKRDPFAVDVSVGKTDQLYRAHGYHTKVPHLAIVPSILHYTNPGDIVLDGFCGSGMTGVAAQWCGTAPLEYRRKLEGDWKKEGRKPPKWGNRRVILNDLGPAASFIAGNYNLPFAIDSFTKAAQRILDEVDDELGWMYQTLHSDGRTKGRINFTVWSEIFACPECSGDVVFLKEALDKKTKKVRKEFPCPGCGATLNKKRMDRLYESRLDPTVGGTVQVPKRQPVFLNYSVGKKKYEKNLDAADIAIIEKLRDIPLPVDFPVDRMMHAPKDLKNWGDKWRGGTASFTHVHYLFLPRAAQALAALWRLATAEEDNRLRNMLLFFVEQAIWTSSVLNRYRPTGFSQVSQYLAGVYYVPSQSSEPSPWYVLQGKISRLAKAFTPMPAAASAALVTTGDCASIEVPASSVDYIFTDPPFGANFAYAELNFLVEAWHRVFTDLEPEAIESPHQRKSTLDYQDLMRRCFEGYHRALKPGRWMTVVFSNNSNKVWRAIQEALGTAGFVVADLRTLDKKQGSFNQVLGVTVNQDLVISAYKPTEALTEKFELGTATEQSVWAFVREHLNNVPVFVGRAGEGEVVVERTAQMLLDRMIAFHVQRGVAVPLSGPDFFSGLNQRFTVRDEMYFLSDQVEEYGRKRTKVNELRQLSLFVSDEASAIQWVRQQLHRTPQTFQTLQPQFMRELQAWAKHEQTIELRKILEQNCIRYDGESPLPNQLHSYLSSNYHNLRNREKDDPELMEKARDRWYVPDPNKQSDLEKLRERALLREFEIYKSSRQRKLKQFRTEAIRVGFKAAYDAGDNQTIVTVAGKVPEKVLQEDEKLLMYYDVASMRLEADQD